MKKTLVIIPARGGSKGIKMKNIKEFAGQPLIKYTLDFARGFFPLEDICLSSDSDEIIDYVKSLGFCVPFKRPAELSKDNSGSREVILHALDYYAKMGTFYEYVVLLQPTSPIRNKNLITRTEELIDDDLDMLVTVKESKSSPYFNLFEESNNGYLMKSKEGTYLRRQDSPKIYEYTGAFYLIRVRSIMESEISSFSKIRKILINEPVENIDLDTPLDWLLGEYLYKCYGQDTPNI